MDQFGYLPSYMYGKLRQYIQPYIKVSRNIDSVIENKLYISYKPGHSSIGLKSTAYEIDIEFDDNDCKILYDRHIDVIRSN